MSAERITQAELARRHGWRSSYVTKLVRNGVVVLVDGKVDPEQADAAIAAKRDPAKAYMDTRYDERRASAGRTPLPLPDVGEPAPVSQDASYHRAKTAREMYNAKISQLDYEERTGKLVDRAEIGQAAFDCARIARDRLLGIPTRLAARFAGMTDPRAIEDLMVLELKLALTELAALANEPTAQ